MKRMVVIFSLLALHVGFFAIPQKLQGRSNGPEDALRSWNDGSTKLRIIAFVDEVCNPDSSLYVPEENRRAFFDMDDTILCEKPEYIEVMLAIHRLREKVTGDPKLLEKPLYKAAMQDDRDYIHIHVKEAILEAFAGMDLTFIEAYCRKYLIGRKHPSLKLSYAQLFYRPMIELIQYLQASGFSVYIVSTSQQEFIRSLSPDILPVPKQNIIGTMVGFKLLNLKKDARHEFVRTREYFDPYNADENKTVRLRERGLVPGIFAVGNSMGDYAMLDGVADSGPHNLVLIVDHDDPKREFEYHKTGLMDEARKRNWLIISIENDFRSLFYNK